MFYERMKTRLRQALQAADVDKIMIAEELQKSVRTIDRYLSLSDDAFFSAYTFATLCHLYNINAQWIMNGTGSMFVENDEKHHSVVEARQLIKRALDLLDKI